MTTLNEFIEKNMSHMGAKDYLKFFGKTCAEYTPLFLIVDLTPYTNGNSTRDISAYDFLAREAMHRNCEFVTDIKCQEEYFVRTENYGPSTIIKGIGLVRKKKESTTA